jgi:hypothetical protein
MKQTIKHVLRISLAAGTGLGCLLVSDSPALITSGALMSQAHAIIGRPLTPLSYAGVARRTTRRAVVAGAAVAGTAAAAAAASTVYARPGCVQVVNAYGQLFWRCP